MLQTDGCASKRSREAVAAAFEAAYRCYNDAILAYIYRRTQNYAVAEELTAEVFARLVKRLQVCDEQARPLPRLALCRGTQPGD